MDAHAGRRRRWSGRDLRGTDEGRAMPADGESDRPPLPDEPDLPPAPSGPANFLARWLADWERTVAVVIAVVTLTAALLTYLAVLQDDASSEARGQATLETLQVQRQKLVGSIRVQGEAAAAGRYRGALAEAEALEAEATAADQAGDVFRADELRAGAQELRYVADSYKETTFDAGRLSGTTSTATYDTQGRLDTIQGYEAFESMQPDQPEHTAQVADDRHDQSVRTLLCVLLLLVLAVLLTVGRILPARWRALVLAVAVTGWVAAAVLALLNATAA
jgi:hypothetical protein